VNAAGTPSPDRDALLIDSGRRAVARWEGFPAEAEPRPLVLLHEQVGADGGFATVDAKIAFYQGAVEAGDGVPDEAARRLRAEGVPMSRPPRALLQITAAVQSETEFATDRGPQRLQAWRVEAVDAIGPIWVLTEEERARCWLPPQTAGGEPVGPHLLSAATVGPGGCQLVVSFVGGSERWFRYDAEVVEAAAAVCVVRLALGTGQLPAGAPISAVGHGRQVTVTLTEPLDGRVLTNLDATPVPVLPA
jgi:hypothetical protein